MRAEIARLTEALEPFSEAARKAGIGGASITCRGSKPALRTARSFLRIEDFGRANAAIHRTYLLEKQQDGRPNDASV